MIVRKDIYHSNIQLGLSRYCLMTNHYHLIQTPDANLSRGMRQLNGVTTQASNRRHGCVGHLFQGRYKASGWRFLFSRVEPVSGAKSRVRAGLVVHPGDWPWRSNLAMIGAMTGEASDPEWLYTDGFDAIRDFCTKCKISRYRDVSPKSNAVNA